MRKLILCDFDGTISVRDTGYLLVNQFTSGNWEAIDQDFRNGKIGSKEAYSRIARILKGDESTLLRFIQEHSHIDSSFPGFYHYCREKGIDIKIVSDGLDFYIKKILEMHRLSEIPFYANCTQFGKDEGIDISFPYSGEECGLCGTCKKKLVQIHRKEYDSIFFVGNGLSDRCAAQEADFVFAKDSLYPYCVKKDITCHFFEDFQEILNDLKKQIHGVIFDLDGTLIEPYEAIYGAKEVLHTLRSDGVVMGIASNKFGRYLREVLTHLGLSDYFKSVIGAADVAQNKPFSDTIHTALKEMDVRPKEAIFVGDTLADIETGKQARVDVYSLPTGLHSRKELSQGKPKRVLKNLQELARVAKNPLS